MARGRKRVVKSDINTQSAKKTAPEPPAASPEVQNDEVPRPETPQNVLSPKYFVLKHTFENVSSMAEGENRCGPIEDHFGLNLRLSIQHRDGYFGLWYVEKKAPGQWHLVGETRFKTSGRRIKEVVGSKAMEASPLDSIGLSKLMKWELLSDAIVDDKLTVECEIRINEMRKIGKKVLRSFDENMKDLSDVVLIVRNQKFYVSKYTLSAHSTYFKSLFLGPYKEANMPEITLKGVDPFDIQNYLEFLYHQPSISDETVEGLLLLADQYHTEILKEKCMDFLKKDSTKSLKKKFKMLLEYHCSMEKIVDEMRTAKDVKEVIEGEDVEGMDQKLLAQLLMKIASLV